MNTRSTAATATLQHLSLQGIDLDLPAEWTVNDTGFPMMTGLGQLEAIVGTVPWGPCATGDVNCHYQQRLGPNEISVDIGTALLISSNICDLGRTRPDIAARGPADPPAIGSLTRVDGRPTIRTDYSVNQSDYYLSDEWRTWEIAAPGSLDHAYTIDARYRGPELATLRAQLDEVVASVRLGKFTGGDPSAPTDCGAPFP